MLAASMLLLAPGAARDGAAAATVHVLGSFNLWDVTLLQSDPGMVFDAGAWRDTVDIAAWHVRRGYQQFKLVTDRAYDVPPDYCLCPDRLDEYGPLAGPVCLMPFGLNLQILAPTPGAYLFTLDEAAPGFAVQLARAYTASVSGTVVAGSAFGAGTMAIPNVTVAIVRPGGSAVVSDAPADPTTGAFAVTELDAGTYDLIAAAPGYQATLVPNVTVSEGGTTDVGTVTLVPGCTSVWSAIQVVGDFNAWNTGVPSMSRNGCVWEDTLLVAAGCHYMKFRTDLTWGDDYGTCTAQDPTCTVPLSGTACIVNGENALGRISFPATDEYRFAIDEATGQYAIQALGTPVRPTSWGRLKVRYR
jgi:hypothetical protein